MICIPNLVSGVDLQMEFNQNQKIALISLAVLTIAAFGFLCYRQTNRSDSGIQIIQPDGQSAESELLLSEGAVSTGDQPGRSSHVVVHVAGEVNKPDVYKLPSGSRVIDAIRKAGGANSTADLDTLNLAALVKDGDKILVPPRRSVTIDLTLPVPQKTTVQSSVQTPIQLPPFSTSTTAQSASTGKLKTPGEGVVNINTADATELQRLPGVGPSTAQKILEFRGQVGRFALPDQLMDVKGIGPKKYEKMKPFICL